jgi:hypothetical protein
MLGDNSRANRIFFNGKITSREGTKISESEIKVKWDKFALEPKYLKNSTLAIIRPTKKPEKTVNTMWANFTHMKGKL